MSNFLSGTPLGGFFFDPSQDQADQLAALREAGNLYANAPNANLQPVSYSGMAGPQAQMSPTTVNQNAMAGIQTNPAYTADISSQIAALNQLRDQGGMNATDRANLAQIQTGANNQEEAQRQSIMQQANMRGMATGGNNLVSQQLANQNAQNQAAQQGLQVAGMAQNRALQAGGQGAALAQQQQSQQYQQQAQAAQAANQIAQYNAQALNSANQYNTGLRQQTGAANAQAANQQSLMNNYTIPQSQYSNTMNKISGQANAQSGIAGAYGQQAQLGATQQGGLWGGAAQLGGSYLMGKGLGGALGSSGGAAAGGGAAASEAEGLDAGLGTGAEMAAFAAYGGKIPGRARYPGNSYLNDSVSMRTSPGEVIIPRQLAEEGSEPEIGHFAKTAPYVDQNKEAMLSALKSLRGKK